MAALFRGLKFASQLSNKNPNAFLAIVGSRHAGHWNKDFKPGKIPQTEEERIAAAKKYNLLPEDYKPYADDGLGYGDYPKLPDAPVESRDPYYPYDFPEHKRNFNEPIHADIDVIGEDRYGTAEPPRYSIKFQYFCFLLVMGGCFGLYYFLDDKRLFRPVLPKQYPNDGKVHYTFEPKH